MVIVCEPATAVLAAVRVKVLVPVVLAGLNNAVTPAGKPLTVRPTAPLKVLIPVTVTVLLSLPPWGKLKRAGESDSEKSGAVVTVRAIVAVCTRPPETPVIVILSEPSG